MQCIYVLYCHCITCVCWYIIQLICKYMNMYMQYFLALCGNLFLFVALDVPSVKFWVVHIMLVVFLCTYTCTYNNIKMCIFIL